MDFAAQLSMINNGAGANDASSPGDEGRGRGRSFSRCQVTSASSCYHNMVGTQRDAMFVMDHT